MKLKASTVMWTFIWCLFMGIAVGSIGIGAIYPPANLIARPFVCPGGKMQVVTQDYHPSPIETVTTLTWYCVDEKTGAKTELGIFPMSLYAGTIYGLLFFVVVFIGMVVMANKYGPGSQIIENRADDVEMAQLESIMEESEKSRSTAGSGQGGYANPMNKIKTSADALARMKELKELRDANLISETEYESKRAKILDDL